MKRGYQCDRKLKIYDHISFYEANLLRAKKLYIPNGDKTPNGRKKLYESKSKTNVNGLIKKYYANIQKMKNGKKIMLIWFQCLEFCKAKKLIQLRRA